MEQHLLQLEQQPQFVGAMLSTCRSHGGVQFIGSTTADINDQPQLVTAMANPHL